MLIFAKIQAMDPMQQTPQQNPYDFITNPSQPNKTSGMGGGSFKKRIIIVAGGALILIIIASVVGTILANAGKGDIQGLKDLALQQQELIRVADLGKTKANDPEIRALAYNASLSTTTQQQKLIAYLETRGAKLEKEELALSKKASVDAELEAAATNNRFDEVFNRILNESLVAYNRDLSTAYKSAVSDESKKILENSFKSSVIILGIK